MEPATPVKTSSLSLCYTPIRYIISKYLNFLNVLVSRKYWRTVRWPDLESVEGLIDRLERYRFDGLWTKTSWLYSLLVSFWPHNEARLKCVCDPSISSPGQSWFLERVRVVIPRLLSSTARSWQPWTVELYTSRTYDVSTHSSLHFSLVVYWLCLILQFKYRSSLILVYLIFEIVRFKTTFISKVFLGKHFCYIQSLS